MLPARRHVLSRVGTHAPAVPAGAQQLGAGAARADGAAAGVRARIPRVRGGSEVSARHPAAPGVRPRCEFFLCSTFRTRVSRCCDLLELSNLVRLASPCPTCDNRLPCASTAHLWHDVPRCHARSCVQPGHGVLLPCGGAAERGRGLSVHSQLRGIPGMLRFKIHPTCGPSLSAKYSSSAREDMQLHNPCAIEILRVAARGAGREGAGRGKCAGGVPAGGAVHSPCTGAAARQGRLPQVPAGMHAAVHARFMAMSPPAD